MLIYHNPIGRYFGGLEALLKHLDLFFLVNFTAPSYYMFLQGIELGFLIGQLIILNYHALPKVW